jgi:uncharacterized membrane protein YfcA
MPDLLSLAFGPPQWAAMLAIALAAGFTHGFIGIGFPLLATPLFGVLFGWRTAVVLLVLPTWLVTFATIVAYRGHVDLRGALRAYWPLLAAMPFGMVAGVHALHAVRADALMLGMATMLCAYLLLDRLGRTDLPWARAHPTWLAAPFGLLAGFTEGALNVAGPVLVVYFLLVNLPVASTIAVLGWLFFIGKTLQSVLMAQRGAFDATALSAVLPIAAVGTAGFALGMRLRARFDPSRYRGWLKATLGAMAAWLVLRVALGGAG